MSKVFHILNGDALNEQFPKEIEGEVIIFRECLVDGELKGDTEEEFYHNRAEFLSKTYEEVNFQDYYQESVSEFEKIKSIPENSEINLWFEEDLFCQVNLWYCVYLILNNTKSAHLHLILPIDSPYSFGHLNNSALIKCYKSKVVLVQADKISELWIHYRSGNIEALHKTALDLKNKYTFILKAVEAHIASIPSDKHPGKPVETLQNIIEELSTYEFKPIFKEFSKREAIYGYGDLQVRKLLEDIKRKS
ncbi:DUF1835 domain-containing protein [Marivirga arenosa]|uniref:DUF1835 domain-containing protein n=1 Tax=Marivirga arenosa TaxID=3059076 RepID=A0AA49GEK0_9BACT|nr:DUF1835 domain-containing protein [Marivirga sp. ABR2-2]WKK86517.2 DUF1835 domain-containing protein [Marivirga sp. ABR2-2]